MAQQINVNVNGQPVVFGAVGPQQVNGRVLVPLRGVLERLGAFVGYEASTKTITANKNGVDLQLHLGDRSAIVNGRTVTLDVPAQTYRGSTMVPLRFVGEALGADVKWNSATYTVDINSTETSTSSGDLNNYTPPSNTNSGNSTGSPNLVINSFNVDASGMQRAGQKLTFTLVGTPGGEASFTIPGVVTDVPMQEVRSGNYVGTYTIPRNSDLNVSNANAVARLKIGSSERLIQNSSDIGIDANAPQIKSITPEDNSRASRTRPNISAIFDDGTGSGVDTSSVVLRVDNKNVTREAQVTQNFISYRPDEALTPGMHKVVLKAQDKAGNEVSKEWVFQVGNQTDVIKSFAFTADNQALTPGTEVTFTLMGEPNSQATYTIGDRVRERRMTEESPGKYVGTYTIRRNDNFDNMVVSAKLVTPNGETYTTEATSKFTASNATLEKPTFTSPEANSKLSENEVIFEGRAAPGSKVQIKVSYVKTVLGAFRMNGTVAEVEVTADDNGVFRTDKIDLNTGLGSGDTTYTATAVTVGANGKKSEETQLILKR